MIEFAPPDKKLTVSSAKAAEARRAAENPMDQSQRIQWIKSKESQGLGAEYPVV
jgi:hypothetical protein